MRLLIINPNISERVTALIEASGLIGRFASIRALEQPDAPARLLGGRAPS